MQKKKKKSLKDEETAEEREYYPAEEQGILPEDDEIDEDTLKMEMEEGEKDENIYLEEGRENLEEDDEIDSWEEGFMEGASGAGQLAKDALTGEPLMGVENVVEAEIDGKIYRFVSEENAIKFRKKHEEEEDLY